MNMEEVKATLDSVQVFADMVSGCKKVSVGSMVLNGGTKDIDEIRVISVGANRVISEKCKTEGCRRVQLYGEDSKNHRLPSDCRSIHSEIDAICAAAYQGKVLADATIVITRYPCEACARAIVAAGIKEVYYGREQEISDQTKEIFELGKVEITWVKDWRHNDITT